MDAETCLIPLIRVRAQVPAMQPVDQSLRLVNVAAQCGCLKPHRVRPRVDSGDILAFDPCQLACHLMQMSAQSSDELHGLGDLGRTRTGIYRSHGTSLSEVLWIKDRVLVKSDYRGQFGPR